MKIAVRQAILVASIMVVAALMIGAIQQPNNSPTIPGWVVVERDDSGDDTKAIQAAIDRVAADGGGTVLLPTDTYSHTGLIGRPKVHLRGTHSQAVTLECTPKTGDGITLANDPNGFTVSDLTVASKYRSTGWGIRADKGTQRAVRLESVNVRGFHNGILITNALNVSIRNCQFGHTFPNDPKGIGIQIGDGKSYGGNGVTISDCYLSCLDKAIVTYAQACLISRLCMELCHTGVENRGITTVLMPWYDSSIDRAHIDTQPNTVGGGQSGTGTLLLGYGSSGMNIKYASKDMANRTVILPERLDMPPGNDPTQPRGVKFGKVFIDQDGVIYAKEFRKLLVGKK
jgi:hypothetical protein